MDKVTPEKRSENMRRIRAKDTAPEMKIRRLLYGLGYRYRLHLRELPGCPDLVFRRKQKLIFVHGCFWHMHDSPKCPEYGRTVKTNRSYWGPKLAGNRARDERHRAALNADGWSVLTVWDCETRNERKLLQRLKTFLDSTPKTCSPVKKRAGRRTT